jgi:hypothetical protein
MQDKSLVTTSQSSYCKLRSVNVDDVKWTTGFWAERFEVCNKSMVPNMMDNYMNPYLSHAYPNFEIAAGLEIRNSVKGLISKHLTWDT